VNAIRTGCSPQQRALPMLLSAAEALKGFVLECRDQGTLSNPCGKSVCGGKKSTIKKKEINRI